MPVGGFKRTPTMGTINNLKQELEVTKELLGFTFLAIDYLLRGEKKEAKTFTKRGWEIIEEGNQVNNK